MESSNVVRTVIPSVAAIILEQHILGTVTGGDPPLDDILLSITLHGLRYRPQSFSRRLTLQDSDTRTVAPR